MPHLPVLRRLLVVCRARLGVAPTPRLKKEMPVTAMRRRSEVVRPSVSGQRATRSRLRRVCGGRRAVAMALVAACLAVFAATAETASAADVGLDCGIGGYPNCLWVNPPVRSSADHPQLSYSGWVHYTNSAYAICVTLRLVRGDGQIMSHLGPICRYWTNEVTGLYAQIDGWPFYCNCRRYHTWGHSWVVYADGTTHAERFAASGDILF
jgi:hypothetical protein